MKVNDTNKKIQNTSGTQSKMCTRTRCALKWPNNLSANQVHSLYAARLTHDKNLQAQKRKKENPSTTSEKH